MEIEGPESDLLGSDCGARVGSGDGDALCGSFVGDGDLESFPIDSSGALTRCSVKAVNEVLSCFDSKKRDLVKSIGFEGLLYVPAIKQINRRLSVWLMSRVDVERHEIVVAQDRRIRFYKEDVGMIFGIPCCGKRVNERRLSRKDIRRRIAKVFPSSASRDYRSIKAFRDVLERSYANGMSTEEEEAFKVSFVVFVMSCFLAPGIHHDSASADYWDALAVPSDIQHYDCGLYVIEHLIDAVSKLKFELGRKSKLLNIPGCPLFLQVIYLDSLNMRSWNLKHDSFPRIRFFTAERIRTMITADTMADLNGRGDLEFGLCGLRAPADVCYKWATGEEKSEGLGCVGGDGLIRECAWLLYHNRCYAADVYTSMLVSFLRMFAGDERSLRIFAKFVISLFNGGLAGEELNSAVGSSPRSDLKKIGDRAGRCHYASGNSELASCGYVDESMLQCGTADCVALRSFAQSYLLGRKAKVPRFIDLNRQSGDTELDCFADASGGMFLGLEVKSPWDLGFGLGCDVEKSMRKMKVVAEMAPVAVENQAGGIPWLVHHYPKYVEVMAGAGHAQILGLEEFDMDLMDVLLRRFSQVDAVTYRCCSRLRWRHYVESDFMAIILFFFPALLEDRWACYAWNAVENMVYIFDPLKCSRGGSDIVKVHLWNINVLKCQFAEALKNYFRRPHGDLNAASVRAYVDDAELEHTFGDPIGRTGMMVAYFCRNFDGSKLNPPMDSELVGQLGAVLLNDLTELVDNFGKLPKGVVDIV
ncbi:unnamed protein product [Urochloa decumbens]|uniref:Uncharacterized protein n=1 Tax=Urochloa decumbens TaxID=240449 RepID=A0ABC8YJD5_9POAL